MINQALNPRLSEDQKDQRIQWAQEMKNLISYRKDDDNYHYRFADEKWFYTTSARKRLKILPQANFETKEEAEVQVSCLRNRRFPTKVISMAVVGKPCPEHGFNGKIFIRHVAEEHVAGKHSYNQNLSKYYEINYALKKGKWMQNFIPFCDHQDVLVLDALQVIVDVYGLQSTNDLVFSYKTYTSSGRSYKWIRLHIEDGYLLRGRSITTKNGNSRCLKIDDLILHNNVCPGSVIIRDTTCDSSFILNTIEDIGSSIRNSYHWVSRDVPITLILDNAGGHGTNQTKETYVNLL